MNAPKDERKKPGPPRRLPETKRLTVMVEPELIEWGKTQPEGLSGLVRRLLREARNGKPTRGVE